MKILLYDPPAGWRYGFPRPYLPKTDDEPLAVTLLRDGYPQKEIDAGGDKCVRFITHVIEDEGEASFFVY